MKKLILILLVLFVSGISYSQVPTYKTTLKNFNQVSDKIVDFDVYIERTSELVTFNLAGLQIGMTYNNAIINGGTLTLSVVPGSSDPIFVASGQVPISFNAATAGLLKIAGKAPTTSGSGAQIPFISGGVRYVTLRLTNSVTFAILTPNFAWNFALPPSYPTKMFAYISGLNTDITVQASHFNELTEGPLPVQLASFTGKIENKRDVSLSWKTSSEINNSGFEVQRKQTDGSWSKVGFVNGSGNSTTEKTYTYNDKKLNTGKYNYRLKQVDNNGNYEYYDLNTVMEVGVPTKYDMSQNYPNPFNPVTKIDFDLPLDSRVNIVLYDITGREVKTLVNDSRKAGYYTVQFNASDLSSGTYFYRIMTKSGAQDFVMTKKMMLVK